MTILLTGGGGTGGHITPTLAVAHELKRLQPDVRIVYVVERKGKFAHLTQSHQDIDKIYYIFAGKFRRYYGESWLKRLFDLKTNIRNTRDFFYTIIGFFQSVRIIKKENPQTVFLKGSYVGVPVGLAAARKHIRLVSHDSDAVPGLANRILSRWVAVNMTGVPTDFYNYPKDKMLFVGIPLKNEYHEITGEEKYILSRQLKFPDKALVLLATGGSLGAKALNSIVKNIVPKLLDEFPNLIVVHQTGKGNEKIYAEQNIDSNRIIVKEFISDLYKYTAVADLVITRGGATNIAELATQAKACIVIANPLLTGAHQVKNAEHLANKGAVINLSETELKANTSQLLKVVSELLHSAQKRHELEKNLHLLAKPSAAGDIASIILNLSHKPTT